jgi:nicotinate phosphoribosyltransferase
MSFYYATEDEIRRGETTDVYFKRTEQILKAKGLDDVKVVAEITAGELPEKWSWAVLSGVEELVALMKDVPVNVFSIPEGTIFRSRDVNGIRIPIAIIEGEYSKFASLETPLLGLLCQSSGITTTAARIRKAAGNKLVISFGIRRMHPVLSPMIDRSAYIGGVDAVSCVLSAERMGLEPSGTMPHSLIILFGRQVEAWKAFDEVIEESVPRVALVDTYFDEKTEAVMAAEALGKRLWGVRLDTPRSRKGNFEEIIREVRWELELRGYKHVKIFTSGALKEESISKLSKAGADGFGVGTRISNAPTIDFALDIVEMEGKPVAKRGKYGGLKSVWRCQKCRSDLVLMNKVEKDPKCPKCNSKMKPLLQPLIKNGEVVTELPHPKKIREHVVEQLECYDLML